MKGDQGNQGDNILHEYAKNGDYVNLNKVLTDASKESIANIINMKDSTGRTPLHYAVLNGDITSTNVLLSSGADPNVQDSIGNTPLHYPVDPENDRTTFSLMRFGADPTIKNNKGKVADPDLIFGYTVNKNSNINDNTKRKFLESLKEKSKDLAPKKRTLLSMMNSAVKGLGKIVGRKTDGDLARDLEKYANEHREGNDKTKEIAEMKRWTASSIPSPLPFINKVMGKGGRGQR